jgi:hypothetical protein
VYSSLRVFNPHIHGNKLQNGDGKNFCGTQTQFPEWNTMQDAEHYHEDNLRLVDHNLKLAWEISSGDRHLQNNHSKIYWRYDCSGVASGLQK